MFLALLLSCDPAEIDIEDTASKEGLSWYQTCGDPVCKAYSGPWDGVPLCTDEGVAIGDTCTDDTLSCDPVDDCNALWVCAAEDPTEQEGGCPISQRSSKDGISYLGPDELAALKAELLGMPLATWRYRTDADDLQRLGFVIEDVPGSPAVRPDGDRVDLYGFVSLATAAIQAQDAEIQALKAEVAALKAARASAQDGQVH